MICPKCDGRIKRRRGYYKCLNCGYSFEAEDEPDTYGEDGWEDEVDPMDLMGVEDE